MGNSYSEKLTRMSEEERWMAMKSIAAFHARRLGVPPGDVEDVTVIIAQHLMMRSFARFEPSKGGTLAAWLHWVARRRAITEVRRVYRQRRRRREQQMPDESWVIIEKTVADERHSDEDADDWGSMEAMRKYMHPFELWVMEHLARQDTGLKLARQLSVWFETRGVRSADVDRVRDRLWRVGRSLEIGREFGDRTSLAELNLRWRRLRRRLVALGDVAELERWERLDES